MATKNIGNTETVARLGINRVARITYSDISAAATSKTIVLDSSIPVGSIIRNFSHRIITNFDGGATSELTVKVGHNGATVDDDDSFIAATSIHADATYVPCAMGAGANNAGGYRPTDVTSIEAIFTSTGANTSALTAGELELTWLEIPASTMANVYP